MSEVLGRDRKTIRQYLQPVAAEAIEPAPEEVFDEQFWRERIDRWFPAVSDPAARALTWDHIAPHHDWIASQFDVPVTVATIAQRLRDDRHVEVSESTVRRYIATTFAEQRLEERVTVPRGSVEPGSEAQIDYGKLGMWFDPRLGRRVTVWANADDSGLLTQDVRPACLSDGSGIVEGLPCRGVRVLRGVPARLVCDNPPSPSPITSPQQLPAWETT